jgi:hypothetical protein
MTETSHLLESRLTPAMCIWSLLPKTEITGHMQSFVTDIQNALCERFYVLRATLQMPKTRYRKRC